MIGIKFKASFDPKRLSREVSKVLKDVATKTKTTAQSLTPIDSGYARSQWRKTNKSKGFKVSNNTPYIQFLDQGSSSQAPQGITKPTVRKITGYVKQQSRRIKR